MEKFLTDLSPGKSIILGWHPTERSGITTIPSDFFQNATLYSGGDHQINLPKAPACPPLENKSTSPSSSATATISNTTNTPCAASGISSATIVEKSP